MLAWRDPVDGFATVREMLSIADAFSTLQRLPLSRLVSPKPKVTADLRKPLDPRQAWWI
jgi:hypothetical protein